MTISAETKDSLTRMQADARRMKENPSLGEDEFETGQALSTLFRMVESLCEVLLEDAT